MEDVFEPVGAHLAAFENDVFGHQVFGQVAVQLLMDPVQMALHDPAAETQVGQSHHAQQGQQGDGQLGGQPVKH